MGQSSRASAYAWHKTQKECICEGKIPGPHYICLLQVWTMFSLASNASYKNQGTEWVVSCCYQKQLSPEFCIFTYETIQTSAVRDTEIRNQKMCPWREIIARIRNGNMHAGCILINEMTFHVSGKVNSIMSVVGEHSLLSLTIVKDIYYNWTWSVPFQRTSFVFLSFLWNTSSHLPLS